MNLKGRSFLTLLDFTKEEIEYLLSLSFALKAKKKGLSHVKEVDGKLLSGKNIVLLFDKTSTRTRCSFEVAAHDEGASVTFLTNSQMGEKESLEDTANVLGRLYDGIEYRGYDQSIVEDLAKYSGVSVWNGLTDADHPTQFLADMMTAMEKTGKKAEEISFAYVGDGRNNVANALMIGCSILGATYSVATPSSLYPDNVLLKKCEENAKRSGGKITVTTDPFEAVKGADVIYTDIWCSMGEEEKMAERINLLKGYQVTMDLLKASGNGSVLFEHCLPSFHDLNTSIGKEVFEKFGLKEMEVTDEVFRSSHSVVFDEAENRMHTIKAVMVATLSDTLNY